MKRACFRSRRAVAETPCRATYFTTESPSNRARGHKKPLSGSTCRPPGPELFLIKVVNPAFKTTVAHALCRAARKRHARHFARHQPRLGYASSVRAIVDVLEIVSRVCGANRVKAYTAQLGGRTSVSDLCRCCPWRHCLHSALLCKGVGGRGGRWCTLTAVGSL